MTHAGYETDGRNERGSALLVAVLLLVFMGVIGLAAMDTVSRDREVAGFTKRSRIAFYAAEAGIHTGLDLVRTATSRVNPPVLPVTALGTSADYPETTQPQFEGDPAIADPIRWDRTSFRAASQGQGMRLRQGTTGFTVDYWMVNSQGTGPNGGTARLEAAKRLLDFSGYQN